MGAGVVAVLAMVLTVTPDNGGLLSPPQITINNQAGDQFDPHVDRDLAAYSNVVETAVSSLQEIRYYLFASDKDQAIPNALPNGTRANDLLSDVDQGRIVFTRIMPDRNAIMLFDTTTLSVSELAPAPSSNRIGVALGAQTVAFIDYAAAGDGSGELMVLDLATSAVSRLTNDLAYDANPAVSPDGNVVTWERCASSANCDIYSATRSGSTWTVHALSTSLLNERSPDTNGSQVVFERDDQAGATGSNVVMVPAAGGAETVLELPGEQFNPSIRGQIVAFESRVEAGANSDIYLIDMATNRVFQVTQTPTFSESLNDVTVLSTGEVRLVWQANDEAALTGNIYGATFSLPAVPPPADAGTGGGAGGGNGGGDTCLDRSVTLEATRFYSPTRSVDGSQTFSPPLAFAIPAEVPVVEGNSANKKVILTINVGVKTIRCEYRGGSTQAHPSTPAELALASKYTLAWCQEATTDDDAAHSAPSYGAGTVVAARSVKLHIQNGDMTQPLTRVRLALEESCTASAASAIEASDAPLTAGCSSAGASFVPFLAAFAFLALLLRRPASIRLVARREQRRLPR